MKLTRNFRVPAGFSPDMRSVLIRVTVGLSALAVAGGLLTGVSAAARVDCTPVPHVRHAPRLLSPCAGAVVPRDHAVVFTAADADKLATANPPFINLATSHSLVDGHLALSLSGNGIFGQMAAVPGRPGVFTYTANRQIYPSWWDNHRGSYWVQLIQYDPRVATGTIYGPITTVRVG